MDALKTRIDLVSLDNRFAAGCSAAGVSFHVLRALVPRGIPCNYKQPERRGQPLPQSASTKGP